MIIHLKQVFDKWIYLKHDKQGYDEWIIIKHDKQGYDKLIVIKHDKQVYDKYFVTKHDKLRKLPPDRTCHSLVPINKYWTHNKVFVTKYKIIITDIMLK